MLFKITLPHPFIYNSSPPISEEKEVKPASPSIILRSENDFLSCHKSEWDSPSDEEEETAKQKVPDLLKDDLASRRVHHGPVVSKVHQFLPAPVCTNKDRERWEDIRRASQRTLQEKDIRLAVFTWVFKILFPPNLFLNVSFSCSACLWVLLFRVWWCG